jgi:hypothetical protein
VGINDQGEKKTRGHDVITLLKPKKKEEKAKLETNVVGSRCKNHARSSEVVWLGSFDQMP